MFNSHTRSAATSRRCRSCEMLTQNCKGGLLLQRGVFLVSARDTSIIADNLSKTGWIRGCVSAVNSSGRTIFVVHAHRGDGKRFVAGLEKKSQRTRLRERQVSQALCVIKKARSEHDLAFWAK